MASDQYVYESIPDAARGLLCDVTSKLTELGVEYIVIGGWCPVLRNQRTDIPHPGTRDVDVLFQDGDVEGSLQNVLAHFLAAGYLVSAKHDFQLLRVLRVARQDLVFNVDLLHPSETQKNHNLFVDHVELDVPELSTLRQLKKVKSIVLPSSAVFFDGYWDKQSLAGVLPNGDTYSGPLNLLDAAGLVISKVESMKLRKRERDAFDVYLMLSQTERADTIAKLAAACRAHSEIGDMVVAGVQELRNERDLAKQFNDNISRYLTCPEEVDRARDVADALAQCVASNELGEGVVEE